MCYRELVNAGDVTAYDDDDVDQYVTGNVDDDIVSDVDEGEDEDVTGDVDNDIVSDVNEGEDVTWDVDDGISGVDYDVTGNV